MQNKKLSINKLFPRIEYRVQNFCIKNGRESIRRHLFGRSRGKMIFYTSASVNRDL